MGPDWQHLSHSADRATIIIWRLSRVRQVIFFPVADESLKYIAYRERSPGQIELPNVTQGTGAIPHDNMPDPEFTQLMEVDLGRN